MNSSETEPDLTDEPKIILIADDQIGQELGRRFESCRVVNVSDEYDMLRELAKQDCSAVMFSAPRDELKGLIQAIGRLNSQVRVVAFCPPDQEQNITGSINECRTYPPTPGEVNLLLRELHCGITSADRAMVLSIDDITMLMIGTQSEEALTKRIAELASNRLGVDFSWIPAGDCPPDSEPILMLPGKPARLLVPNRAVSFDEHADAIIADLHQCTPTLLSVARRTDALNRLAITDCLTDAYNRRYFYHLTDRILSQAAREGFRTSLLLYDIDNFKRYNDEFGHATGDEILRETAVLIREITREQDIVARIGGDEFAVLFWDSKQRSEDSQPLRDAWDIADRFRQAVEKMEFSSLGSTASGSLTISGGLASFPEHGNCCQELLRQADAAMRKAKESGKNVIHLIGRDEPSE